MIRTKTKRTRIGVLALVSVFAVTIQASSFAAAPTDLALKSFPDTSRRTKPATNAAPAKLPEAPANLPTKSQQKSPAPRAAMPTTQPKPQKTADDRTSKTTAPTSPQPAQPKVAKPQVPPTTSKLSRVERLPVIDVIDSADKTHAKFIDLAPASSRRRYAPLAVTPRELPTFPPKPTKPESESPSEFVFGPLPSNIATLPSKPSASQPPTFAAKPQSPKTTKSLPAAALPPKPAPERQTAPRPQLVLNPKFTPETGASVAAKQKPAPTPDPTRVARLMTAKRSDSPRVPQPKPEQATEDLTLPSTTPAHLPVLPKEAVAKSTTPRSLPTKAVEDRPALPANSGPKLDAITVQPPVARKSTPALAPPPLASAPSVKSDKRVASVAPKASTAPKTSATSAIPAIQPPAQPVESYVKAATRIAKPRLEYAVSLAQRGAYYSAREELRQALWTIAQAHDTETESYYYTKALDAAFLAFKECDDLASILGPGISRDRLNRVIGQHKTPIAEVPDDEHSSLAALRQYVQFAEDALVTAAGGEKFAAELLYTFARVTQTDKSMGQSTLVNAKSIALYRASMRIDDRHVAAANELAVMLGTFGQLFQARDILAQATQGNAPREVWQNLAAVHNRLGDRQSSQLALNQSQKATRNPAVPVTWVEHATFAGQIPSQNEIQPGTPPREPIDATAKRKKPSWTQKLFGTRFGSAKKAQQR